MKATKNHQHKSTSNQDGLVSFIVVIVLMFVLTIIVVSFSKLVNREQAQTLDRQLATQAFYAAESGVNDAVAKLSSATPPTGYNDDCTGSGSFIDKSGLNSGGDPVVLDNGISYSCLLVDDTPNELVYGNISTGSSTVIPLNANGPQIDSIEISWQNADKTKTSINLFGCTDKFPESAPADCEIGVLRAELLKWDASQTRENLMDNQGVVFASPKNGGAPTELFFSSIIGGEKIQAPCTGSPKKCTLKIKDFSSTQGYLRLRSIYFDSSVTIRAFDNGGDQLEFTGAQVEIDATGRASGVVRRIKVTRSIKSVNSGNPLPEFALQTKKTQCKRFTWMPGDVTLQSPASGDDCDPTK